MLKINFLKYANGNPVMDIDGYYTNGEIMALKEVCEEIPQTELSPLARLEELSLDEVIEKATKHLNYVPYKDNTILGQKIIIDPLYIDFIRELLKDEKNTDFIANKYSAIKVMRDDKLVALVMPKKIQLNQEQLKMLLVNNFKEYVAYKDLIPVEYKLVGKEEVCGFFFPRLASDEYIKKFIQNQVKHNGGRWLGKFERRPDLQEHYAKLIGEAFDKSDRSGILQRMTKVEEKLKDIDNAE